MNKIVALVLLAAVAGSCGDGDKTSSGPNDGSSMHLDGGPAGDGGNQDAPVCSLASASTCPAGTVCTAAQVCLPCFTPTLNTNLIGSVGGQGCLCDPAVDSPVCLHLGEGLECMSGRWTFFLDGPCMPPGPDGGVDAPPAVDVPPAVDADIGCTLDSSCPEGTTCKAGQGCMACFSPTSNTDLAGIGRDQGCPCDRGPSDIGVCVQTATGSKAMVCNSGQWHFVYDGPCMPAPPPDAGATPDAPATVDGSAGAG